MPMEQAILEINVETAIKFKRRTILTPTVPKLVNSDAPNWNDSFVERKLVSH